MGKNYMLSHTPCKGLLVGKNGVVHWSLENIYKRVILGRKKYFQNHIMMLWGHKANTVNNTI